MKVKFSYLLFLLFIAFSSCQDDTAQRKIEQEKEAKKNDAIFKAIEKAWVFNVAPMESGAQNVANSWNEWRNFLSEINQKPKSTIGAFQKKAKTLSLKVVELNNNIPAKYNLPQIKSRIAVLTTKIKSLNLFINLNQIPEKKVVALIPEINSEISSLQLQMQEIVRKSLIPIEDGEEDIIRMKDTSRAVPSKMIQIP